MSNKRKPQSDDEEIIERISIPPKPKPNRNKPEGSIHEFTLEFLQDLANNNNREWFQINKNRYDAAKENMIQLVEHVQKALVDVDESLRNLNPKDCLFRINRDIRFSHDKSPYKTYLAAQYSKNGKKSGNAGYYIHIQPGNKTLVGAGLHHPDSTRLNRIRQGIDSNPNSLKSAITSDTIHSIYGNSGTLVLDRDDMLKKCPKGYSKDHPERELLCFKSFTVCKTFPDSIVISDKFPILLIEALIALAPFVFILNEE